MPKTAPPERLAVLYRDDLIVAVCKPAGLLVHRSPIDRHETRFALQIVRNQLRQRLYPVHRLDKPTSGVLLFALDPDAARQLSESLAAGRVRKSYLAVVRGSLPLQGCIDHPLVEEPDPLGDPDTSPDKDAQGARTEFRRLAETELPFESRRHPTSRYSLANASPLNGRRHQIRRHFKHIFHPILGDVRYGDGEHNRLFRRELGIGRMLLHAAEMTFPHPQKGVEVRVAAPLDDAFRLLLENLGWIGKIPADLVQGFPAV
jgi:tRNA pseudouridine65 synthase